MTSRDIWGLAGMVLVLALLAAATLDVLHDRNECGKRGGIMVRSMYSTTCVDSSAVLP